MTTKDELRAELTRLSDACDLEKDAADYWFQAYLRVINMADRKMDVLRAYATEAYERGYAAGMDTSMESYDVGAANVIRMVRDSLDAWEQGIADAREDDE